MWLKKPAVSSTMDYTKAAEVFVEELLRDQQQMDAVLDCDAPMEPQCADESVADDSVAVATAAADDSQSALIDWTALIGRQEQEESSEPPVDELDTASEAPQQVPQVEDDLVTRQLIFEIVPSVSVDVDSHSCPALEETEDSCEVTEREKRNAVLRSVMAEQQRSHEVESQRLREGQIRAQEAEEAALAAKALAQVAEQKAYEAEAAAQLMQGAYGSKVEEQAQGPHNSEIKLALQLEKQRSAEFRKKRNQAAQLRELKERAERTLQEAQEVKERAVAEAAAASAQLFAQARADAFAVAGAEALALRSQAEAEAEEIKACAQETARAIQAELEVARQAAKLREMELEALQAAVAAAAVAPGADSADKADFEDEAQWEIVPDTTGKYLTKGHGWDLVA